MARYPVKSLAVQPKLPSMTICGIVVEVWGMLAITISFESSLLQVSGGKARDTGTTGVYARDSKWRKGCELSGLPEAN